MASLRNRSTKFTVPNEPGEWMAFRRLSEREIQERTDLSTERFGDLDTPARFELALAWLKGCLVAWSYEEACTVETCRELLDRPTLVWAFMKAMAHSLGMETAEEKKADSPDSTATSTGNPELTVPPSGS
jgi:hypothetical protein